MPVPGHGEVRIRVAWAGVNRPDALQRSGAYDPPPGASDLPGLEASGVIDAVGAGVTGLSAGDAVCALLPGGGYGGVRGHAGRPLPARAGGLPASGGRLPARDLLHRLDQLCSGGAASARASAFSCTAAPRGSAPPRSSLPGSSGARGFATAGTDEKCATCVRPRRRGRIQLPLDGFCRRDDGPGRREPHPRHGGRRLPPPQCRGAGR